MIRLYGPFATAGHGSFLRVAEGMRQGLEACGKLAGTIAIDDPDVVHGDFRGHESVDGADAPVAVFVGDFRLVSLMRKLGKHAERWVLLPVNSTWMPKDLLEAIERHATGLIAPSRWCAEMLRTHTKLPVRIWQHGVTSEFQPHPEAPGAPRDGNFMGLHLTSTTMERKGTKMLIEAWSKAFGDSEDVELAIVSPSVTDFDFTRNALPLSHGKRIVLRGRADLNAGSMAILMNVADAVIQPSRGEAFGLVPLEALACGVPVVATRCTGHTEYLDAQSALAEVHTKGSTQVRSDGSKFWDLFPIDDGPGAMAPDFEIEELVKQLRWAREHRDAFRRLALEESARIREHWSWPAVTSRALVGWEM